MSSNWKEIVIDKGEVSENKKFYIIFEGLPNMKTVKEVRKSCRCIKAEYNEKYKDLHVKISVGEIPYHLKEQGFQEVIKFITVIYDDGTNEVLKIKYVIKNGTPIQDRG